MRCYCKFGKKSQINLVELIFVLITLFIAFGVLFPGFVYKSKWREASMILNSRDLILTIDRIGKLYEYSFNQTALKNFLENVTEKNLIPWSEVEGTSPNMMVIVCNCTEEDINKMNFWFNPLFVNDRRIYLLLLQTNLEEIPKEADVLLIKGYKNLTGYSSRFKSYIANGVGIIELMDFDSQAKVDNDETQTTIFGLKWNGAEQGIANMVFSSPTSVRNITYLPYKNFYHVPLPLNISSSEYLSGCQYQPSGKGNLTLNQTSYSFWICNYTHVWFDTNADGTNDTLVRLGEKFSINVFNLTLNYIHDNISIAVSFKPNFTFSNYFSYEQAGTKYIANITPSDNKKERILLKAIKDGKEFPTVILNSSKVAWMYDLENPSDEEKTLLLSLLLWASKKKSVILTSPIRTGFSSSYINVQNKDIFEVYKFSLGLSSPY